MSEHVRCTVYMCAGPVLGAFDVAIWVPVALGVVVRLPLKSCARSARLDVRCVAAAARSAVVTPAAHPQVHLLTTILTCAAATHTHHCVTVMTRVVS